MAYNFPMRVYLDNNATTSMRREVREALVIEDLDGNASSMHESGRIAAAYVEDAREKMTEFLGAKGAEIFFTSGATESNNTVFKIARSLVSGRKTRILTTKIEHPSIIETVKTLVKDGFRVTECDVDAKGRLDLDMFSRELEKGDVVFSSVMAANNETGTVQPVAEACRLAHEYGSLFHTDATQVMGKLPFDFSAIGADYASVSAHKFYGPKGVGVLCYKKGAPFVPFMEGGHQEDGRRAGTYNSAGIYASGVAAALAHSELDAEAKKLCALRDRLKKGIEKSVDGISFNSFDDCCLPGTLNVSFDNVEGESILLDLDFEGIEVSTGSACATGSLEPSYVLLAGGVPVERAHSSIRFSFGRYNTEAEVDYVLEKLPPIIARLRKISTRK